MRRKQPLSLQPETFLQSQIFLPGPAIEAHFIIEKGLIQAISLYPSSSSGLKVLILSSENSSPFQAQIKEWLEAYTHKQQPSVTLPLNLGSISDFTFQVLHILQSIPFGSITSYGQIATQLGYRKAARAVGGACGRNPFPLVIPCHRVLSSTCALGGFSEGIEVKERLLAFEGIL